MAKNVTSSLKEHTKDLLSEEALGEIEQAFNEAVEQRASLQIEAALTQQDEAHAAKVNTLLEAIDNDHTKKLNHIVGAVSDNHARKLKMVIGKYQNELNTEAGDFKGTLVENISNYLDLYLEKAMPADTLKEAVDNKRSNAVLGEVRKVLGVDLALAKHTIRDAIVDGKEKIDKTSANLNVTVQENAQLKEQLRHLQATSLLSTLCKDLPENKETYITKVLCDKDLEFIKENFNYTLSLFDKEAQKELAVIKEEAVRHVKGNVDPAPVIQESVNPGIQVVEEDDDPLFNTYMGELGKY